MDSVKTKIMIVGFGVVGQGFFDLFHSKKESLGLNNVEITEIVDKKYGYIERPPIDLTEKINGKTDYPLIDPAKAIKNSDASIVCEFTWVNYKDAEPAFTHMKTALENGKHVITTNKGPVALRMDELKTISKKTGNDVLFKGTVMAGTPSFNIVKLIPGAEVLRIRGILNGTTNFILEQMSKGSDFGTALKEAQKLGYAEADPTNDVEGFDSAAKVAILSNYFGWKHRMSDVQREGIKNVSREEAAHGTKLLATISKTEASVAPLQLEDTDLLRHVNGVMNALEIETDSLGPIYTMGPGAGRKETAQAALTDLMEILNKN
jgi:homoserine dehydrogenase